MDGCHTLIAHLLVVEPEDPSSSPSLPLLDQVLRQKRSCRRPERVVILLAARTLARLALHFDQVTEENFGSLEQTLLDLSILGALLLSLKLLR